MYTVTGNLNILITPMALPQNSNLALITAVKS